MQKEVRTGLAAELTKLARADGTAFFVSGRELSLSGQFQTLISAHEERSVCFVDGGNAGLLSGAGFCVAHIRVGLVVLRDKKWKRERYDAYVTVSAQNATPDYAVSITGSNLPGSFVVPLISGLHPDIRDGAFAAKPERVAALVRHLAELHCAVHLFERQKIDVLVLDGELEGTSFETLLFEQIKSIALLQKTCVVGLAKTCTALTTAGMSATAALIAKGPIEPWVYISEQQTPLVTGFLKLHPKSKHVFRIDGFFAENIITAARALVLQSTDPLLVGYPYGLIAVDHLARISDAEAGVEKQSLLASCDANVRALLASTDAHQYF